MNVLEQYLEKAEAYHREVVKNGRVLCRACAEGAYYRPLEAAHG